MAVDKEQRTRALRYKRPALASMGYEHIQSELEEIVEACDDVACILRQQHYIQLQNEEIQRLRERPGHGRRPVCEAAEPPGGRWPGPEL